MNELRKVPGRPEKNPYRMKPGLGPRHLSFSASERRKIMKCSSRETISINCGETLGANPTLDA